MSSADQFWHHFARTARADQAARPSQPCGILEGVSIGDELLEQRRRARQAGDPRVSAAGRELFRRMTTGDLVEEFQADLDAIAAADPMLSGEADEPAD